MGKRLKTVEHLQKANWHLKKCSLPSVIRKRRIKAMIISSVQPALAYSFFSFLALEGQSPTQAFWWPLRRTQFFSEARAGVLQSTAHRRSGWHTGARSGSRGQSVADSGRDPALA